MAMVTVETYLPKPLKSTATGTAFGTLTLDATGEKHAWILRAPRDGTLDGFEFLPGTVTSWQNMRLSFQSVDGATGYPDETVDQYRDVTSQWTGNSWFVPGLLTSDGTDSGSKRTVTRGELLACVVEFVSTAGNLNLNTHTGDVTPGLYGAFPYMCNKTAAGPAWQKASPNNMVVVLKYDDGTYATANGHLPASAWNSTAFNNSSNPNYRGLRFSVAAPIRINGVWVSMAQPTSPFKVVLAEADWDGSDGNAIDVITLDGPVRASTGGTSTAFFLDLPGGDVVLAKDTYYRLLVVPTSASNVSMPSLTFASAAIMNAIDNGAAFHYTEAYNPNDDTDWTNVTTRRPAAGLIVNGIDDGGPTNAAIAQAVWEYANRSLT